jgi:hypothetical protein
MINEFTAKKLGEVLAFSFVGTWIFEQGKTALLAVFPDSYSELLQSFSNHENLLRQFASEARTEAITFPKSQKTGDKLQAMAQLYIGEEWDNSAELLEWLGFFEGAALVHWHLVFGAARSLSLPQLVDLASSAITFHSDLFQMVSSQIEAYASTKALS